MNFNEFQGVVDHQLQTCSEFLVEKGREYVRNNNPLHVFDVGESQSVTRETREDVIHGMARKHWISIQDIRNDIKHGRLASRDTINEKFTDMINYLIFEKASLIDRHLRYEEQNALQREFEEVQPVEELVEEVVEEIPHEANKPI